MGRLNHEAGEIHAKIVYFGAAGAGKTANVRFIHNKLKREHRGELRIEQARKNKTGEYEFLPVQLGSVRGFQTSLHVHTVPGAEPYRDERRRILDGVDAVVFVADVRPERHEATLASLEELKQHLESFGRSLDDVLLVIQYNHTDGADENALDALHKSIAIKPEAAFEAIASNGTGVLQCLTTLSKGILSKMRHEAEVAKSAPAPASEDSRAQTAPEPVIEPISIEPESRGFSVESSGAVETNGRELRIPIRLVEDDTGRKVELTVRLTLDA